ncbi:MAG: D-galactonate dehydratase family protein [Bacteroidia bacterium]
MLGAWAATPPRWVPADVGDDWVALMHRPVVQRALLPDPLLIEQVEVLQVGDQYLVRVRTRDGAEGLAAANPRTMRVSYPILLERIVPVFVGRDARDLEALLEDAYVYQSNYKWQGLPFWSSLAALEFAVLDLLGKAAGVSVGTLLGGVKRSDIAVYHASEKRGNTPEAEIEYLQKLVERIGNKALKFRLGARMRYDADSTRRDKALIPLARKVFGDDATLYADANGSYDVKLGIEIGRLMEDYGYAFYEEPCPFDHYEETYAVARKLRMPVALGEQESSLRRFVWLAQHRIVDILQPDLLYFGGLIRSIRVSYMADRAGIPCTPHMSGNGMGFLYVLHFAACVNNPGPFQEYKGDSEIPVQAVGTTLLPVQGMIRVPEGPGLGVEIDPGYVARGKALVL